MNPQPICSLFLANPAMRLVQWHPQHTPRINLHNQRNLASGTTIDKNLTNPSSNPNLLSTSLTCTRTNSWPQFQLLVSTDNHRPELELNNHDLTNQALEP